MRICCLAIAMLLISASLLAEEHRWGLVLVNAAGGKWKTSEGTATVRMSKDTISFTVFGTGYESLDEKTFTGTLERYGENAKISDLKSEIPQSGPSVGSPYTGTLFNAYPQVMEGAPYPSHTEIITLVNEFRFIGISRNVKH